MEKAFSDAKAALCKTALLVHPQQGWELALIVDVSSHCVGATLQQRSSPWQPLAFFSKKLEPSQIQYCIQLLIGSCWLAVLAFAISGFC
jgi:hypothetical protein